MSARGQTTIIGLHDAEALADGATSHKQGAGIYVSYRGGGSYDIGVSDGDAGGGEFVQSFQRISATELPDGIVDVKLVVDGTANPATCASNLAEAATADGCLTLTINDDYTVTDSYGSISPAGSDTEFADGGHPGWYVAYPAGAGPDVGVAYDLTISPAVAAPSAKDQCKDGGFADYAFKNQGQCISSLKANAHANK